MWWPFGRHASNASRFVPIAPAHLRLGMYVWLPCRWYQHPFPSNRFRLTHPQQCAIIQRLSLRRVYYDPQRSDCQEMTGSLSGLSEAKAPAQAANSPPPERSSHERLAEVLHTYQRTVEQTDEVLRRVAAEDTVEAGHSASRLILYLTDRFASEAACVGIARLVNLGHVHHSAAMHALDTTLLALGVGRELKVSREALHDLGLAALLHDIGEYVEAVPGRACPVTASRAPGAARRHPEYGRRLVRRLPTVPARVAEVIYQHHEHLDGSGYPRQLRADAIEPLARILRVIDHYTDLVNQPDAGGRRTPQQALSELYVRRKAQVCPHTVVALVRALSIYPPGSFVQLTDGAFGFVLTMHPHDRLRPLIAVYRKEASGPRTDLLDLAAESTHTIARSLTPSDLPPAVLFYFTREHSLHHLLA